MKLWKAPFKIEEIMKFYCVFNQNLGSIFSQNFCFQETFKTAFSLFKTFQKLVSRKKNLSKFKFKKLE